MIDFEIEIDKNKRNCSAYKIFDINIGNISENNDEYWVSNCLFDTSLKISKKSKEGIQLKKLIDKNSEKNKFIFLFDSIVLKRLSENITLFKTLLDNYTEDIKREAKIEKSNQLKMFLENF